MRSAKLGNQLTEFEIAGFDCTHLQGVVCMHNKGFNLQYCHHVSELSAFHIFCQHTKQLFKTFIPTKIGK